MDKQIQVVIDVEMTGRYAKSMFAVAVVAQFPDGRQEYRYVTFPEVSQDYRSVGAMGFWNNSSLRKAYLENALAGKCGDFGTRKEGAEKIRTFIDALYATENTIVFFSDFAVFDHGAVNSLLSEFILLPLYLKEDGAYPSECVDHSILVKGLAGLDPTMDSSLAYRKLGLSRGVRCAKHDPYLDALCYYG